MICCCCYDNGSLRGKFGLSSRKITLQESQSRELHGDKNLSPSPTIPVVPIPIPPLPHWVSPHLRPVPTGCVPVPSPSPQNVSPSPPPSPLFLSPFPSPSPSFKISSTQWVTLSFGLQKNHPLVFSNSNIMWIVHFVSMHRTAGFYYISVMLNALKIRRPTPQYYRNKSPRSHGITVNLVPIPAVLP